MTRFQFAFHSAGSGREVGVVRSDDYRSALELLDKNISASAGDVLEIGVPGFPPMRYEAVSSFDSGVRWQAALTQLPVGGLIAA